MTLYLRYAARSDRGLVRSNNQDSVFAGPRLLAVADGMGGHVGGEVASKVVIAAIEYLDEDDPGGDMLEALRQAVDTGTDDLRHVVDDNPDLDGMGTTLTALLFNGKRIGVCHVGDSRAYLLRDDELTQITHDDTFVQALLDEGRITEEEASVHPQRSVILRALNGMHVDPDLSMREGRPGDRYLLCSDGLSSFVSAERIGKVLRSSASPSEAADQLIDFALRAGGPDNITVIVADLIDDNAPESSDGAPVVDGAAGNNQGQRENTGDTPAGRAALLRPRKDEPAEEADDDEDSQPKGTLRRRLIASLIAVVLIVGLLLAGRAYVGSQYFVGVDGADVVIYNGVDTEIGPVKLYSLQERTDYQVSDLEEATQVDVREGLSAGSLTEARQIVARLDDKLLPLCPDPATSSAPSPSAAGPSASDPGASDPSASGSAAPTDTAAPNASASPTDTAAPGTGSAAGSASASASGSASSSAGASAPACREGA
ncbi:protein phosphatase [Epidermidibacterium keratini]|uniref:Serine/threonine protein phosphatase PstP n=1 Tax=Epidermidibacterium keratini TaxID=1891644 RepID=A0A7L4YMC8_9ACTN|nr:PP2C family serine/threonine-protein phosphatase [Epidermidibacterium keratini]QHC00435.1 protein phosphatase [Epidermidibacterium keratini]